MSKSQPSTIYHLSTNNVQKHLDKIFDFIFQEVKRKLQEDKTLAISTKIVGKVKKERDNL